VALPAYLKTLMAPIAIVLALAGCVETPAARSDPQSQAEILGQSIALLSQKRFADALTTIRKLRPASSSDARVIMAFAIASDMEGQFAAANRAYARLADAQVPRAELLNNMGYSMMLQGKLDAALGYLREAQRMDPANPTIRNNLKMLTSVVPTR